MIEKLPNDVQLSLLDALEQRELVSLSACCTSLNTLTKPYLVRSFRCVTCAHPLFNPQCLVPPPRESRPRRDFYELRTDASHNLRLDDRRGAANFHVLRHLRQTAFRNVRFPLPEELQAVRALRCPECDVFVGFRHDGVTGVGHEFIHKAFVELVDAQERVVSISGALIGDKQNTSKCANPQCSRPLFDCDDREPWTHVLSGKRLTDMDPYLEWEHSWAGPASASHPAFFVKRLKRDSYRVSNVRVEHLRQGVMEVGDVHCAGCANHIGWKLLAEVPDSQQGLLHNYDQVGRFGVIRNAVTPVNR